MATAEYMRIYRRRKIKHTTRKTPKGTPRNGGLLSTSVVFDPDMFQRIRDKAAKLKTSFSEQARTYIEWGFMAEDE